jgi:hypothetical protein
LRACGHDVLDLHIDDVANDQFVQLRFARVRMMRQHMLLAALPNLVLFQLPRSQNFKINRIVEVVAIISDLVRQIGNLRFE